MRGASCVAILAAACAYERPSDVPVPDAPPTDALCGDGDGDGDGICNNADDWPCGSKPDNLADEMIDSNGDRSWGADSIVIGDQQRVVVAANGMFPSAFRWNLKVNCGGPAQCFAFLEIGYGATRIGCVRGGIALSNDATIIFENNYEVRAPATPGLYELRLNAARQDDCGDDGLWFGGDPGPESTIAHVCVSP